MLTGKDRTEARRMLVDALCNSKDKRKSRTAWKLLRRLYKAPGFDGPTWVVTYSEAQQLLSDALPDEYAEPYRSLVCDTALRFARGDSTLIPEVNANARKTTGLSAFARASMAADKMREQIADARLSEDERRAKREREREAELRTQSLMQFLASFQALSERHNTRAST